MIQTEPGAVLPAEYHPWMKYYTRIRHFVRMKLLLA